MHGAKHAVHNVYKGLAEQLIPVLTNSSFREKGVLSPDEFVVAGDFLVSTCPTWSWESGDRSKRKAYLPPEKQFLATRNVPCLRRADAFESVSTSEDLIEGAGTDGTDDGWLAPNAARFGGGDGSGEGTSGGSPTAAEPAGGAAAAGGAAQPEAARAAGGGSDDEDVPDMDDYAAHGAADAADDAALPAGYLTASEPVDNFVKTRTYDVSITYDKYYQTPRIWLVGYDEARMPLLAEKALQDVSHEHARKTVTIDGHPHTGTAAASVHPCRHAAVMKKIVDMMADGSGAEPRVEQYLFVFLKRAP